MIAVYADEPATKPSDELERADQQGEDAAEHVDAEGELEAEVVLPLLGEVDLGVERQVPRRDEDDGESRPTS